LENSKTESMLTYNAAKQYVKENFPEYDLYFDDIWEFSVSQRKKGSRESSSERQTGGPSFVSDDLVIQIAKVAIPFLSGVFSSVLADIIREKIASNKKQVTLKISAESERIRVNMHLDKKFTNRLLPYIFREIEKEATAKKQQSKRKST
jgi:hypothetical protein